MKNGSFEEKQIITHIDVAIEELRLNPFNAGSYIEKSKWPRKYKILKLDNLRKFNLPNAWRLIYTIISGKNQQIVVIIEWMDHRNYDNRFNY